MPGFISYQMKQIREGGFLLLIKKLISLPVVLFSIPIVIILRILRPWIIVRFGSIPSERIGHFAANMEAYLCERNAGICDPKAFDIFYYNAQVSNYQLKKMWDRILRISQFSKFIDKANRLFPGYGVYVIKIPSDRDNKGLFNRIGPHLSFTKEEDALGDRELKKLGIKNNASFVCFHARDSVYLDKVLKRKRDWSYHNFRNSNIDKYIPAAEELTRRGYFTVRMGATVEKPLTVSNKKVIDYAVNGRTEFLDIYLGAKCRFFICDTAGIYALARVFRHPVAYVNCVPLKYVFFTDTNSLFIPKKLWIKNEKRFLTFREILNSDIGRYLETSQYEKAGIEVIENTAEEITALSIEMDDRLNNRWRATEEAEELQKRFKVLLKPSELNKTFLMRIGTDFLIKNRELLN